MNKNNKVKMYKVLKVKNNKRTKEVYSPVQDYYYGELDDILGKELICTNFDESNKSCSNGFYAVEPEGLLYCLNDSKNNKVFEVEMSGKNRRFNQFKHRFEKQTVIRMLDNDELDELLRETDKELDYDFYRAIKPLDPRTIEFKGVDDNVLRLLQQVDYVKGCVMNSVMSSVLSFECIYLWEFVNNFVNRFMRDFEMCLVWQLAYAYVGSCFPNIKKWEYIDNAEGEYPFQCYIDLMELGVVPVYSNYSRVWKLYAGKNMKVVYKISKDELKKLEL